MKAAAVAVVASLVLAVCAVDETHSGWQPANSVSSGRTGTSMLTKLRSAVKRIELLAEEVDAALSIADTAGDHNPDTNWMPVSASNEMLKRDDTKRKYRYGYGRRRHDNYGVAGRFGRSTN